MSPTQSPTIAPTGPTATPSFKPSFVGDALQVLHSTQVINVNKRDIMRT